MSDGDALLRAILEHPAEDTPRLMYADWLEEHDGHAGELRARFIRDQVWLWANPSCGSCTGPEWSAGKFCLECREREERRGRTAVEMFGRERWLEWSRPANLCVPGGALWDDHIHFARGFVSEIHLPIAAFMRNVEALFRAHPIERVTLTDRESRMDFPYDEFPWFTWFPVREIWAESERWDVPIPLAGRTSLIRFDASEDADKWLSARCIAYGRELAGLSKIPLPA